MEARSGEPACTGRRRRYRCPWRKASMNSEPRDEEPTEEEPTEEEVPASASPARVLIADDHDLVREGLRAVLAGEEDLRVVGEARDGQEALKMCRSLEPDLVLMDVRMPKSDGLEATD